MIVVQLIIFVELTKEIVILIINVNLAWDVAPTIVRQIQPIFQLMTAALMKLAMEVVTVAQLIFNVETMKVTVIKIINVNDRKEG